MATRFARAWHLSLLPFRRRRSESGRRGRTLSVERLETRMPLDAAGLAGLAAAELTLSFVPDGTSVAGQTSSLFADPELQRIPDWQGIVAQAFQTWADLVHVPVRVVGDSGDPLGALGTAQGDARFGDVRVAGISLPPDTIAMSVPYADVVVGTWAGDFILSSDAPIRSAADLYSVALHEAGHVFGLGHSSDPASPMYFHGISPVTVPTQEDISNLRNVMGVSTESPETRYDDDERDEEGDEHDDDEDFDRETNDDDEPSSRRGEPALDDAASQSASLLRGIPFRASGELTSRLDVEVITLPPQSSIGSDADVLTIQLRVVDFEGFIPAVTLLTRDGRQLTTDLLSNSGGLLVVQAHDVDPRRSYSLRVEVAQEPGHFNSGRYELDVQYSQRRAALAELYSGQLTGENTSIQQTLTVRETSLVHLVLSVNATNVPNTAAVWVTVTDLAGNVVQQIAAQPGTSRSAPEVLLPAGEYCLSFSAGDARGESLSGLSFTLQGQGVSLPLGPRIVDPIRSPALPSLGGSSGMRPGRPVDNLVVSPVIYPVPGAQTAPPQPIQVRPPWNDPNWWYWSTTVVAAP